MTAKTHAWTFCLAMLLLAARVAGAEEAAPARGGEILAPFKRDLQAALRDGLARGPVEAVTACQVRAPEIADARSRDDVRVGRTSHRLRNPANVAPEWVGPILEAYLSEPSDRAPRSVALPGDRTGYVEPILAKPLCLTCHGDRVAPDIASRIQQLYPADRAVGFDVGDLRGVFWTEFPRAE